MSALPATQAANVESRIKAIERLGQHGTMPRYWRTPLAIAFGADEVAATTLLEAMEQIAGIDPDEWHEGDGWKCVEHIQGIARNFTANSHPTDGGAT